MRISNSNVIVEAEEPWMAAQRDAWQRKLFQAAIQRTKQLTSWSSNDTSHQCNRMLKERQAREKAYVLHKNLRFSNIVY